MAPPRPVTKIGGRVVHRPAVLAPKPVVRNSPLARPAVPPPLYVTSFSMDIYRGSGRRLLHSFFKAQQPGKILACYEGSKPTIEPGDRTLWYNLDTDVFLQDWLKANRDVIPEHLGGTTKICECRDAHVRHSKFHVKRCHWHWMNRNASRWFRKVASLRYAATLGHDRIIWLDSDTVFKRQLPAIWINGTFRGVGYWYFRGHRPAIEAGIMGFSLATGGATLIQRMCERYTSRDYLEYDRWDDGYQFAMLVDEGFRPSRDLVHPTRWARGRHKTSNVIPTTSISAYLEHHKGMHSRDLDIML